MSSVTKAFSHDVQAEDNGFERLPIKKVGVRKIKAPINIKRKSGDIFSSVAHISAYCDLDKDKKGINMSRNARVLFENITNVDLLEFDRMQHLIESLAKSHETDNVYLKIWFEYLYEDRSPISGIKSYEPCIVTLDIQYNNGNIKKFLQVISNVTSCCPCSKNMSLLVNNLSERENQELYDITSKYSSSLTEKIKSSGFGAHNQRSEIDIKVEINSSSEIMWIEDIVNIAKNAASARIYNVLKRPDEKYVTEVQYSGGYYNEYGDYVKVNHGGPKFCEDIARDAAKQLNEELDKRIIDYVVVVNNEESIHTSLLATSIITANRNLS